MRQPLIILAYYRHGTHWLCDLLAANGFSRHPCRGSEIGSGMVWALCGMPPADERATVQLATRTLSASGIEPRRAIDALRAEMAKKPYVCIMHHDQWRMWSQYLKPLGVDDGQLLPSIFGPQAFYVHLTRDPVDCAVSMLFAEHASHYTDQHRAYGRQANRPKPNIPPPAYDWRKIDWYVARQAANRWDEGLLSALGAYAMPYERLLADAEGEMRKLAAAVGFVFRTADGHRHMRQTDGLKQEYAERYRRRAFGVGQKVGCGS